MALSLALALALLRMIGFFTEPRLAGEDIHAIDGERSRVISPLAPERPERIVTWNIERGIRFEAIRSVLEELDADVVLLQEVDRLCSRSGNRDVARDLAVALGMNWVAAGEFQEIGEGRRGTACLSGQAILSRQPIHDVSAVRFQDQASMKWRLNPAQPRRGARMALRASTGGAVFYSIHLESGGNERLRASQVRDIVADANRQADPVMIGGDFNTTGGMDSPVFSALSSAGFSNAAAVNTTSIARRPIDWIFMSRISGTATTVGAPDASDHDPVVLIALVQPRN